MTPACHMCLFQFKPLVVPIPTIIQSALWTSPTEMACTDHCAFGCAHIPFLSVSVRKSRHHDQCQQSPHAFQSDKIACIDPGILTLLNGFNGLSELIVHSSALLTHCLSCPALELEAAPLRAAAEFCLADMPLALPLQQILCWIKLLPFGIGLDIPTMTLLMG